jgi:hypothetical protein
MQDIDSREIKTGKFVIVANGNSLTFVEMFFYLLLVVGISKGPTIRTLPTRKPLPFLKA